MERLRYDTIEGVDYDSNESNSEDNSDISDNEELAEDDAQPKEEFLDSELGDKIQKTQSLYAATTGNRIWRHDSCKDK